MHGPWFEADRTASLQHESYGIMDEGVNIGDIKIVDLVGSAI
jgi:hypothetical protein